MQKCRDKSTNVDTLFKVVFMREIVMKPTKMHGLVRVAEARFTIWLITEARSFDALLQICGHLSSTMMSVFFFILLLLLLQ